MGFSIKGGFARLIGHIFYDKAYLKGRHFSGSYSNGWRNVMRYFFIQKIIGINRGVPLHQPGSTLPGGFQDAGRKLEKHHF